jgi:hypothetical protein
MSSSDAESTGSVIAERIDAMLVKIQEEIDERDFTGDDFVSIGERLEELVFDTYPQLTKEDHKAITLKVLNRVASFVLPHMDEPGKAVVNALLLVSGSTFDAIYKAILKKFDLDGDGEISAAECHAVCCGKCM